MRVLTDSSVRNITYGVPCISTLSVLKQANFNQPTIQIVDSSLKTCKCNMYCFWFLPYSLQALYMVLPYTAQYQQWQGFSQGLRKSSLSSTPCPYPPIQCEAQKICKCLQSPHQTIFSHTEVACVTWMTQMVLVLQMELRDGNCPTN